MTATFAERTTAWRRAARLVHDIEVSDRPEPDRLADIEAVLKGLAARTELFPEGHFPRQPETSGGLYRLAHSPDGRGGLYVSLGFTGRGGGNPHTHASWAAVAGVSGGTETNYLYEKTGEDQFALKDEVVVGPGDAILLPTGAYHTISVVSDTPVLHVHAYGHAAERPGFQPPLPVLDHAEAHAEVAAGRLVAVALHDDPADLAGPFVLASSEPQNLISALSALGVDRDLPVVLIGDETEAGQAAARLYEAGRTVVFRLA